MPVFNLILAVLSLLMCISVFIPVFSGKASKTADKKVFMILVVFAFMLALGIRLWKFGIVPGGINQDGAMAGVDAKALSDYGTDRFGMRFPVHFTAWGFGQMSVLMSYMMIPFIKLMGLCSLSLRLPTLIVSLAGLAFLFLFCKDNFGRLPSLIILFLAAINPWHIMQSRWALDCNLLPHFFIAGIYFLNRGINSRSGNYIISMLFFGLAMYCYGISIYTVTLYLLLACIWLVVTKKISLPAAAASLTVYLLIAWPFIACMIINALKLESIETGLFTIPYFPGTVRAGDILFFSENIPEQLISNLKCTLGLIFQLKDDSACNMVSGFGTMYVFSVPFILLGFAYTLITCKRNSGSVLTLLLFFVGIFDGIITANVNVNRLNIIFYALIIFCGLGIYCCVSRMKACAPAVALMYTAAFCVFVFTYFGDYAEKISNTFLEDFGSALVYSESIADSDTNFIITSNSQYDGAAHVSEILTLYYHDIDAHYFQSEDYNRRYIYKQISEEDLHKKNTVFVCTIAESLLFNSDEYDIRNYGRFCVVSG